jgi:hypothetical protein
MQLVPFNNDWADSGSKLDLKGIYESTTPGDTRICSLPIRRHNDWARKGLRFVTLSTLEDVAQVRDYLRNKGISLTEIQKSYVLQGLGPFDMDAYLKETPDREAREAAALRKRLGEIERNTKHLPSVEPLQEVTTVEAHAAPPRDADMVPTAIQTDSGYVPQPKKRGRPRKVEVA